MMEGKRKEGREGEERMQVSTQPSSSGILSLQCTESVHVDEKIHPSFYFY